MLVPTGENVARGGEGWRPRHTREREGEAFCVHACEYAPVHGERARARERARERKKGDRSRVCWSVGRFICSETERQHAKGSCGGAEEEKEM